MRKLVIAFLFWGCSFRAVLAPEPVPAGEASSSAQMPMLGAAQDSIAEVQRAKTRFKDGEFDEALELLREAVKKHPDRLPPAQVIVAMWYGQANQGAAALGSLERAVVEDPTDPDAYVYLANAELQAGRVTAAGLVFDKAHTLAQSFTKSPSRKKSFEPRIYAGLAAVSEVRATMAGDDKARAQEEWVKAEGHLNSWLKLDPKNSVAMQRLARALFKQRRGQEATALLRKAAEADPAMLPNWAATVIASYLEEDPKAAEKMREKTREWTEAQTQRHPAAPWEQPRLDVEKWGEELRKLWVQHGVELKPRHLGIRLATAQWYLETGQLQKAREHSEVAVQIDPNSVEALITRGVVELFCKDYKAAEGYFLAVHVESPGNFAASNNLAVALCEQDDERKRRRALEHAQDNARLRPESPEALSTLGWVLYKLGRIDEAERALRRATVGGSVGSDTAYYLGRLLADRNREEEAKRLLEKALRAKRPFYKKQEAEALLEQLAR